jgi:hypothetical protein
VLHHDVLWPAFALLTNDKNLTSGHKPALLARASIEQTPEMFGLTFVCRMACLPARSV